ncbi:MAG: BON domain-containing protein [Streptosporangiaceae bacterium]
MSPGCIANASISLFDHFRGLLRGSFIPPADIKTARDVIRYRAKAVQPRTSELQRLGNVLQDAGLKIDSVASSIATKSGRAMIEALIDGERRPAVLADLARGKLRAKIPDLTLALEGRFGDHHALMCRLHLDHISHLDAMIAKLDAQIEAMMQPFRGNTVTLSGHVRTWAEHDAVMDAAWMASGVYDVQDDLYITG